MVATNFASRQDTRATYSSRATQALCRLFQILRSMLVSQNALPLLLLNYSVLHIKVKGHALERTSITHLQNAQHYRLTE